MNMPVGVFAQLRHRSARLSGCRTGLSVYILLLNFALALGAMLIIVAVWSVVHLLARARMGEREMSCHGPTVDAHGNAWCCKGDGQLCEEQDRATRHTTS